MHLGVLPFTMRSVTGKKQTESRHAGKRDGIRQRRRSVTLLQRRGYGQSFISFYRNKAVQLGCHVLRLDTLITNQKSQAMYTKLGFSRAGQTEADVDNNGTLYTLVGFEKAV